MKSIVTQTTRPATSIPVAIYHDAYGTINLEIVIPTEDDEAAEQIAIDILTGEVELTTLGETK